ncbi:4132_t:CDS:2, partial [Cetraspora pellucida]
DFNEDDINLTIYFEEITHCNENINNTYNNLEPVSLKKSDSFDNFDDAEFYVCQFAEYKEFKVRLRYVKMIDATKNKQIKKSLSYTSSHFIAEKVELLIDNESLQSKNIDDEPDIVYLSAKKVWGLACTAVNKYMLHCDYEFVNLIEVYLEKIQAKKDELVKEQEVFTKGRPKSSGYNKNVVTTIQEQSNKKCEQYICRFCKQLNYNIATCSHKRKESIWELLL